MRGQRGLAPTDAALDLLPHAQAMEAAAGALVRSASGKSEETRGTVRITASDVVGSEILPAILARFRDVHTAVAIELVTSNRMTNLLTREADIAVRMVRPEQGSLIAKRIGTVTLGLYAHKRYLRRRGLPRTVEALRDHATIGFDTDIRSISGTRPAGIYLDRDLFDFRTDNAAVQLAVLRAGAGIGGVQHRIAARDPDLVPVLADTVSFSLEMWLAMHRDLRTVRRVRVMFDHLAEALAAWVVPSE